MKEDERLWAVKELLFGYVKSPSLRHIRDPHSVTKLAQEIVRQIDRGNSIWRKWDGQREILLKSAMCCWIPMEECSYQGGPTLWPLDDRLRCIPVPDRIVCVRPNWHDGRAGLRVSNQHRRIIIGSNCWNPVRGFKCNPKRREHILGEHMSSEVGSSRCIPRHVKRGEARLLRS